MAWGGLAAGILATVLIICGDMRPCEPQIHVTQDSDAAVIRGTCTSAETAVHNCELHYELIVERSGAGGTSRTRQAGEFTPGASSADTLATTRVSYAAGDEILALLTILDAGQPVATREIRRVMK